MTQDTFNKPTCSTRDAAELLGISVRTAQLWVEEGRLSAWKTPGGHRRILRASVDKLLAEQRQESGDVSRPGILILDDDPTRRHALQAELLKALPECAVTTAQDAFEGLIQIGEETPEVLITDLGVTGLDGFQMLEALARNRLARFILVIVLASDERTRGYARSRLPDEMLLLVRPVDCHELAALIRAFLKRAQKGRTVR